MKIKKLCLFLGILVILFFLSQIIIFNLSNNISEQIECHYSSIALKKIALSEFINKKFLCYTDENDKSIINTQLKIQFSENLLSDYTFENEIITIEELLSNNAKSSTVYAEDMNEYLHQSSIIKKEVEDYQNCKNKFNLLNKLML